MDSGGGGGAAENSRAKREASQKIEGEGGMHWFEGGTEDFLRENWGGSSKKFSEII